ncbi:MAG TPA: cytochrome c [Gaiellaceae bacterium]|nr:cytochrome c [Gaiellaceae bacterium]
MLSTIALVVAGLSTGHKIGLVVVAAAFIIFALVSSFVLPRRNPDFPGKHIGLYIVVSVCFFAAMMAAVVVFGRESPEASAGESTTTTTATTTGAAPSNVVGDPVAGKAVFASAGCTGCHTLKAAGATGTVGPNLDQLKPTEAAVKNQVIHGGGPMPAFAGKLTPAQIQNVAAFVYVSTHS